MHYGGIPNEPDAQSHRKSGPIGTPITVTYKVWVQISTQAAVSVLGDNSPLVKPWLSGHVELVFKIRAAEFSRDTPMWR